MEGGTRSVQVDLEYLRRLTATVVHDVQLRAAVGPKRYVDAVRLELERSRSPCAANLSASGEQVAQYGNISLQTPSSTRTAYSRPGGAVPGHPRRQHPLAALATTRSSA
jgi:hypothetical protein